MRPDACTRSRGRARRVDCCDSHGARHDSCHGQPDRFRSDGRGVHRPLGRKLNAGPGSWSRPGLVRMPHMDYIGPSLNIWSARERQSWSVHSYLDRVRGQGETVRNPSSLRTGGTAAHRYAAHVCGRAPPRCGTPETRLASRWVDGWSENMPRGIDVDLPDRASKRAVPFSEDTAE